jgi:hypothetical protein
MKNLTVVAAALLLLSACGKTNPVPPVPTPVGGGGGTSVGGRDGTLSNGEPKVIQVEHVLIAFAGTGTKATRTKAEAQNLAYEIVNRVKSGEDFTKLRKELSDDDPSGGVYKLVNNGVAKEGEEYERTGMVPAFGDVGFRLKVGEIGVAEHDQTKSPYGWHVIKRLQ